jgi:uncharacterized phiE125 gp8 family phage protein
MRNYGTLKLTVTSPVQTFTEPITATEMAAFLRLPGTLSVADEALLESQIQAAREVAEMMQGRDLVAKQCDLWLDCFGGGEIELRDPLASVDLITYKGSDGTTTPLIADTDYIVDTVRSLVMPVENGSWPSASLWPSSAVLIRHTTAPPTIDATVLNGIRYLVAGWFEGRLPFGGYESVQEMPLSVREVFVIGKRWRFA